MPTPLLQPGHPEWPNVEQAWQVYSSMGGKLGAVKAAAEAVGRSHKTVHHWIERYRSWQAASPGQQAAVERTGLDVAQATHGWRVIQHEDGSRDSVFWKAPPLPDDTLERIRAAFEGMEPAAVVPPPTHKAGDLLTAYLIADAHFGLKAWGRETGEDFDTKKAAQRLRTWVGSLIMASPPSETALILDVGDLTHADDTTASTPKSKHGLDVDTRHFLTLDTVIIALNAAVEMALQKHKRVKVRILPGNHNPHAYMAIVFALAAWWRENDRVEVEKEPGEFYVDTFGSVLLAAHHGDKAKAERMVLKLAADYPELWGQSRHRYLFTGHLHHHKSQDIGGVHWEQLRAMTARDAYAAAHAYTARAELQAITYHREKGEVSRARISA